MLAHILLAIGPECIGQGFRVQGSGFRVMVAGFMVPCLKFRV
jgi:hypothetical protein